MSKFHSSVSRRDFMKGLGLTGAGLGAAAATTPVFHDLDELMSSPQAGHKFPWYVKERDHYDLTVEVDWPGKPGYDGRGSASAAATPEKDHDLFLAQATHSVEGILTNKAGDTYKDHAIFNACRSLAFGGLTSQNTSRNLAYCSGTFLTDVTINNKTIPAGRHSGLGFEELGLPRYSGTPEENMRMCTAAIHFFGGAAVGALAVDEKSSKIFSTYNSSGKPYIFADVDEHYSDATYAGVTPSKCKWILIWIVPQGGLSKIDLTVLGKGGTFAGYQDNTLQTRRMSVFLRTLGYLHVGTSGSNPGMGITSGLGELGRTDYLISPETGGLVRYSAYLVTDLPLTPTKPIDAGIWRFCQTCKKCSEKCPAGALSMDDEPTFELHAPYNGYGNKSFHIEYDKCLDWRSKGGGQIAGGCGVCQGACVFSKQESGSLHEVTKAFVANTGIFNSFFKTMDDAFGYGEPIDPAGWWERDLDSYPYKGWYRST